MARIPQVKMRRADQVKKNDRIEVGERFFSVDDITVYRNLILFHSDTYGCIWSGDEKKMVKVKR